MAGILSPKSDYTTESLFNPQQSSSPTCQSVHLFEDPNRGSTYSADRHGISSANEHCPQSDIFVSAQRGEIKVIGQLIEWGRVRATDRHEQNITPLHWMAINVQSLQLAIC